MNGVLITTLLLACLVVKSHGQTFEQKVEKSLLRLENWPFTYFYDCEDALNKGFNMSGVYHIQPKAAFRPFKVWCDMETEKGGWIIIQARFDGLINFFRTWEEYRNGFGSVDSTHWLGNNFIRHITENNDYELKIELTGYEANEFASVKYSPFQIGSEDEKYYLNVGTFTGNTLDSLTPHNGLKFSTIDNDNDNYIYNCAEAVMGGWWYDKCYHSNLNGVWMSKATSLAVRGPQTSENIIGIVWGHLPFPNSDSFYSLKSVEMKVRKMRKIRN